MPNVETQIAKKNGVSVAAIQSINGQTLPESFVFTIDTSLGDGLAQFQLPFLNSDGFGVTVNWGDGNVEEINTYNAPATLHSYSSGGTYTIRILGYCYFDFQVAGDYQKVTDFGNWGSAVVMDNTSIRGCDATITTTGQPPVMNDDAFEARLLDNIVFNTDVSAWNVEYAGDLGRNGLAGCTSFNGDCSGWKLSNSTSLQNFFNGCSSFNQDVSEWSQYWLTGFRLYDTGVTVFSSFLQGMFSSCTAFNCGDGPGVAGTKLRKWKIDPQMTNLSSLFSSCDAFNQELDTHIENPGPNQYTAWDVSNVTAMAATFSGVDVFDRDLSSWDTGNVESFNNCFGGSNVTDSGVGSWDVSSCTDFRRMFFDQGTGEFNGNIGSWTLKPQTTPTPTVAINFEFFFRGNSVFNQNLGGWTNTDSIGNFSFVFMNCSSFNNGGVGGLNTGLDSWRLPNATILAGAFQGCSAFDQYIGSWGPFKSTMTNISSMFNGTSMSKDLTVWDTSNIQNFSSCFRSARVNANFGNWEMDSATSIVDMCNTSSAFLTDANVALSLIGWNNAAGTNTGVNATRWCALNGAARTMSLTATETTVSTGTNTTPLTTFKLVDSAADFVTDGVAVGDIVRNTTSGDICSVVAVDNLTTLTIGLDIFTSAGDSYTVTSGYDGAAAKAAYDNLELATGSGGKGWTMTNTITWV